MAHLLVLRGPSGSGKSTIARTLRAELGRRTTLVEQDQIRRTLLWEWDEPGGLAPQMIEVVHRPPTSVARIVDDLRGRFG